MRRMAGGAKERARAIQLMDPEGSRLSAEKVVERRKEGSRGGREESERVGKYGKRVGRWERRGDVISSN